MLRNISIGYANAEENWVMAVNKKRRIPWAFYRLGLLYLFLNFPNIKHIAYIYNRSIDWGEGSPSNRTTALSTQPRQRRSRAVAVTKFRQPVIAKQISVGLTVIER